MGKDKSLILYHNKPQGEYLFDMLSLHCERVFTSCRSDQHVPASRHPLVDRFDVRGPLNGILTAFEYDASCAWLIAAVDMPHITPEVLAILVRHRDPACVATCFMNPETQQPEPLLTLWEPLAAPLLLKFFQAGGTSPRQFLSRHPAKTILPPNDKTLLNINYPDKH